MPNSRFIFNYSPLPNTEAEFTTDLSSLYQRVMALVLLCTLAPLLALLAFVIKCDDCGRVFFRQKRIGQFGQAFTIIKFRTMRDGQITGSGKWLRQTGLDELPQLWNILRGDMAFVGPRPLTQEDIGRLGWVTTKHQTRWHCKPGITGLAQLYSGRGKRVSWLLDNYYVKNSGVLLDLKILVTSALIGIMGKRTVKLWLIK